MAQKEGFQKSGPPGGDQPGVVGVLAKTPSSQSSLVFYLLLLLPFGPERFTLLAAPSFQAGGG